MDQTANILHVLLSSVCPITGVWVGDPANVSTWGFWPDETATPAQVAAATAFIATLVPPLKPTVLTAAQFQARFTQPEQGAIWAAAAKDTTGAIGAGLTLGLTAPQIDLTDVVLKAWMDGLVSAGAITSQRETEILTP